MILVAGHYCHDTILRPAGEHRALGGSAAYASAILDALHEPYEVAAKAGPDFLYAGQVTKQPRIVPGRTSAFIDDYRAGERRDSVAAVCEPLHPGDLQGSYEVGLACAITCELPEPTLAHMRGICRVLIADAQSLLREITPSGQVRLTPLRTQVRLDYLKASRTEAALLDLASLRTITTLLITDGARGCTLLTASDQTHVPALAARETDPTGAGDCFLAGFAVGIARGLDARRAARIGAYCGARAVERVGVPRLTPAQARGALAQGSI